MPNNFIEPMLKVIEQSLNTAYDEYVKNKLNDLERELNCKREAIIFNLLKDVCIASEYDNDSGFSKMTLEFKPSKY